MPPFASVPTRRDCPRCGASLPGGSGPGTEPSCGSCLLLAGLGDVPLPEPPPEEEIATLPADAAPEPDNSPGRRLGGHVLVRQLGHGSMGVIYEARQLGTGRSVALKTINRALLDDADVRTRFAREAEAAASLDHPNLLPVYEVGEEAGRPYFTMKLAEGGSLLQAMPRYAGRPREAVALMAKVARGLAHAHGRGVLHRDLKPGNVLLDADGTTPLVADFGLARWLDQDSDLTQSLVVFGTPGYMAPEQARHAGQAGPGADVYSLGAMLFQLLCGRTPFRGGNAIEVIEQARAGPAPPLRSFNPKAARDLETICARCLELEPSRRPRCAADLAEDLERWLAGRPIRLRPVRLPERVWRWTAVNPWLAAAGAGCLLLGGVAAVRHRESMRLNAVIQEDVLTQNSVVVMPLDDIDRVGEPTELASTLDAALLRRLGAERGMRIASARVSVDRDAGLPADWQHAGQEVHALAVLSGSVRSRRPAAKGSEGVRVILRWAAVADGRVLARRVLDFPSEAEAIAAVPDAALALAAEAQRGRPNGPGEDPDGGSRVPEAVEFWHAGRNLLLRNTQEGVIQSVPLLRRAVELDPQCASAHAWLASALAARGWFEPGRGWTPEARRAAEVALRLDAFSSEAHRALAVVLMQESQLTMATEEMLSAYELDPVSDRNANLLGWQCRTMGQPLAAIRWFERAERRATEPGVQAAHIGDLRCELGDDVGAEIAYRRHLQLRPDDPKGGLNFCWLWLLQGKFDQARGECRALATGKPSDREVRMMAAAVEFFDRRFPEAEKRYRELVATDRTGGEKFSGGLGHLCVLGFLLQRSGETGEGLRLLAEARQQAANEIVQNPDQPQLHYALAAACACLGDKPAALDALERALDTGLLDGRPLRLDPRFDSLAAEPRFAQLLSRLVASQMQQRRPRQAVPNAD